jgi:hypothetical protein
MREVWREVGSGVYVRRHESYDLNVGLVVGASVCAVVDTRISHEQGRELADAVRQVLGLGHTDNDVVVEIPDADVVFAGDLIEQGAPPVFADAFPLDWPSTLDKLAARVTGTVVPGHGDVVTAPFVREQAELLATVAAAARIAYQTGTEPDLPLPPQTARTAYDRAYRQMRCDLPS